MPGGMQVEAWWLHYCLCEAASQHVAEDQPRQDCFFVATSKLHLITANRKPFHLIFFSVTCPTLWLEVVINWVWIVAVGLGIT